MSIWAFEMWDIHAHQNSSSISIHYLIQSNRLLRNRKHFSNSKIVNLSLVKRNTKIPEESIGYIGTLLKSNDSLKFMEDREKNQRAI